MHGRWLGGRKILPPVQRASKALVGGTYRLEMAAWIHEHRSGNFNPTQLTKALKAELGEHAPELLSYTLRDCMLTTAVSVLAAIALLLPGFIIVELSAARGARSSRSDLELALRALTYALLVHLAFSAWTAHLVQQIDSPGTWQKHVGAIVLYSTVVLVVVPTLLGVVANVAIAKVERRDGPAPLWAAAIGAGEARDGYDFMWQSVSGDGTWVIVELVGHTTAEPRLVGGLYGRQSAVGQTPAAHDLYLQRLCFVAANDPAAQPGELYGLTVLVG